MASRTTEIRIGLKGLAKFVTAGPSQQRKILRDYKNPDPDGRAQAMYYREARDIISTYHEHDHASAWLIHQAQFLDLLASQVVGQTSTRYKNNARALREYAVGFGNKQFGILPDLRLSLTHGSVRISVVPDLHVKEKGKEKIIKLDFSKDKPDDKAIRLMTQAMFEAQSSKGLGLTSASVLYFDIRRGTAYKGARASSRMQKEIQAACKNIEAIWSSI